MATWADSIFKLFAFARYNAVVPSPASGEAVELQATATGALRVAVDGATFAADGATRVTSDPSGVAWTTVSGASGTIKSSPGRLFEAQATNVGAADTWLHLLDATTRLAAPVRVPVGATVSIGLPGGRPTTTNLAWACCTTGALAAAADAAGSLALVVKYS